MTEPSTMPIITTAQLDALRCELANIDQAAGMMRGELIAAEHGSTAAAVGTILLDAATLTGDSADVVRRIATEAVGQGGT